MTNKDDPRLEGRHPEFARMSLRPGIGFNAVPEIASAVLTYDLDKKEGDVPAALRHGTRILPLGRYLRGHLRLQTGHEKNASPATLEVQAQELSSLRATAFDSEKPLMEVITNELGNTELNVTAKLKLKDKRTL